MGEEGTRRRGIIREWERKVREWERKREFERKRESAEERRILTSCDTKLVEMAP